jgi:hypothetical protein
MTETDERCDYCGELLENCVAHLNELEDEKRQAELRAELSAKQARHDAAVAIVVDRMKSIRSVLETTSTHDIGTANDVRRFLALKVPSTDRLVEYEKHLERGQRLCARLNLTS